MRVLIVDDDHMTCLCLKQLIRWREIGCEEPLIAYNGVEAIRVIEREKPDIVISDVRMPVLDGRALCEYVYEHWKNIAFLFISAYEDFKTAQMAIRYHAKGYVLKPLDRAALRTLEELIENSATQRSNELFYDKLASGEYKSLIARCLEQQDLEQLKDIFAKMTSLKDEVNIQAFLRPLLSPLLDWMYRHQQFSPGALFEMERQYIADMDGLEAGECIDYLYVLYATALTQNDQNRAVSDTVWKVQSIIQRDFASRDLDIRRLGEMMNLSPVYLGRLFIERTGMKLTDYITECRLQYACEQLAHTLRSVKEIAMNSGYSDANYFAKVFRQHKGMTPLEYRSASHRTK